MNRLGLLVLGVHRSGTSALAGTLIHLGAQGPKTLMQPGQDNPLGYWESNRFYEFHERLLGSLGSEWSDWRTFSRDQLDSAHSQLAAEFGHLLKQEFGEAPLFVAKDPRICRFVPFWLHNLQIQDITPAAVISIRSPLAVAHSLQARNGIGAERSLLIWLRHLLDAEAETRNIRRSFVRYHDLLEDWRAVADRISADIGFEWPARSGRLDDEITHFLRSELCHHTDGRGTADIGPPLAGWISRTCRAIDDLVASRSSNNGAAHETLDLVRREFDDATSLFGAALDEQLTEGHRRWKTSSLETENGELQQKGFRLEAENTELRTGADDLGREVQRHADEISRRVREAESLRVLAQVAEQEKQRLATELEAAITTLKQIRSDLASAQSTTAELQTDLLAVGEEVRVKTEHLTAVSDRIDALLASGSWRVTAPLRTALDVLLRIRSRGGRS